MLQKNNRLDYKWVILVVCFFMEVICLGFCSSNVGLYTKAVTEALEIKRSVYSLTSSIRYAFQVVTALFFGSLINKFGIKKMALSGLIFLTVSVVIRAFATKFYHLYIGGAFWGTGIVFCGSTMAGTIVRRWFHKDVGKYTGIVMSANGIGGAIAAQIITPIINNGEVFGYRKAYLLSATISIAVTALVVLFLRENPEEGPVIQEKAGKKAPRGAVWTGLEFKDIKRRAYFYTTVVLVFLTGISLQSVGNVSVVYMADVGLPAGFIATAATVSSLGLTFAKVIVGAAYDKKGLVFAMRIGQIAALASFVMTALISNSAAGMVLAMCATVLNAVALPLETVILSLLSNDLFGAASFTKVLGILMAANALGLCLGSPLADMYFDIFGTYKPCFWFFAGLMAFVTVAFRFVIRAAYKEKEAILAE